MPKLKLISLFSGCGGMDLGFEGNFHVPSESLNPVMNPHWADESVVEGMVKLKPLAYEIVFANDILEGARKTWINNFSSRGADKTVFHSQSIVDLVKAQRSGDSVFPQADVLTGGFPCQDFSVAGKRKGFNSHKAHHGELLSGIDDPTEENRGKLYVWMKHVIGMVQPKMFIAENVKGLVSLQNVKQIIESDFASVGNQGYVVLDAPVLKAYEYGVPQSRERIVFIGLRKDALKPSVLKAAESGDLSGVLSPYPEITHGTHLAPFVTVKQALKGLAEPDRSEDPDQQTFSKAKWYGRHCQGQTEVKLDFIGPTIRAEHHGNIEFRRLSSENGGKYLEELQSGLKERRLTIRECARIQTFPDEFSFVRKSGDNRVSGSEAYKVIGNAVPPLLAYHLAHRIQEVWEKLFKSR